MCTGTGILPGKSSFLRIPATGEYFYIDNPEINSKIELSV